MTTTLLILCLKLGWLLVGLTLLYNGFMRSRDAGNALRAFLARPRLDIATSVHETEIMRATTITHLSRILHTFTALFGLFNVTAAIFAMLSPDSLKWSDSPFSVIILTQIYNALVAYAVAYVYIRKKEYSL